MRLESPARNRLLSLALLILLLQATLPFFTTHCPFEQSVQAVAKAAQEAGSSMPSDCPMLAHRSASADTASHADPHKQRTVAFCALCNVLCPLHGYVAAGPVSLPPPIAVSQTPFPSAPLESAALSRAAGFSARAPPASI